MNQEFKEAIDRLSKACERVESICLATADEIELQRLNKKEEQLKTARFLRDEAAGLRRFLLAARLQMNMASLNEEAERPDRSPRIGRYQVITLRDRKPTEVRALQLTPGFTKETDIRELVGDIHWVLKPSTFVLEYFGVEGLRFAHPGEWLVRESAKEIFTCSPDVFLRFYTPIGDASDPGAAQMDMADQNGRHA
jgi:hypothetical protein